MSLKDALRAVIAGEVDDSKETRDKFSRDASLFRVLPELVVKPKNAHDVAALVKKVTELKETDPYVSLTPRAAGTDMSGGPLTSSIVVDMQAHMNRMLEIHADTESGTALVEPGMFFRDFDKETKRYGLELPSYTASRELCAVGGMVGNNAGGEKNLKYGKTARYVESLDVVLSDGNIHTITNLSGKALKEKLQEQSFEGDLYRAVAKLVSENAQVIEEHKPKVEKNSSGFAIWDIGDGVRSLNLARLFVGAQGSLGIITKIKFKLVRPKPKSAMAVVFVSDLAELGDLVPFILDAKPDSFESYDDNTFRLAARYFPEFALQMKTSFFSVGIQFLPELFMMLVGGVPKLVLLVEFRDDVQAAATGKAEQLVSQLKVKVPGIGARVARDERASRKYWVIRRESFSLLRKKVRGKRTAPFIDDFVVPPNTLSEFLPKLQTLLKPYQQKLFYTIAGHVGDGNFHIIPLINPKDPDMPKVIEEVSKKVYDLVLSYNGSISGEHNDGLVRTPFVEQMFGREMYELFRKVEHLFDPLDIFNPGKKVGTSYAEAASKLDFGH